MIISHKHRFIFLKTEKTAGTSLQTALASVCGPDDLIVGPRRHPTTKKTMGVNPSTGLGGKVPTRLKRFIPGTGGYYAHMRARQVRAVVGGEVWESYFKFAVERNPWDRQVSNYYHRLNRRKKRGEAPLDFETYITSPVLRYLHHVRLDNWGIYTIDDEVAVDAVLRYEALESECQALMARLGLPDDVALPQARAEHRPDGAGYQSYYTKRSADIVGRWYAKEIEAFGYTF
ncbi:MAG: sulfotransferase family protein [Hyphomicrobiales bacterium]|nr:sulfotransferase family protein [Hyphomicrobiales bacterium]